MFPYPRFSGRALRIVDKGVRLGVFRRCIPSVQRHTVSAAHDRFKRMWRHPLTLRGLPLARTNRRSAMYLCRSANARWRATDAFISQGRKEISHGRNESAEFTQLRLNCRNPVLDPKRVIPGRTFPKPSIFSLPDEIPQLI